MQNDATKRKNISRRVFGLLSFAIVLIFVNSPVFEIREEGQFFFKFFNNFWCNFGLQIFYFADSVNFIVSIVYQIDLIAWFFHFCPTIKKGAGLIPDRFKSKYFGK